MSDIDTPRPKPGPWDLPPATADAPPAPAPARDEPVDKGQHPVWAVVSTLLLGGFIWYVSGSWIVAVAAIWGLFVHEYGHVLAMNALGTGPARIYIIPFLGALARSRRMPASEYDGVKIALAGPAFGLLAAIPWFGLFLATGEARWVEGVFVIAMLNLINLAPAPPLDGSKALGPVLARIHPWVEKGAMLAVGLLVVIWGLFSGALIFATFLGLSLVLHLRRGGWRPEGRRLSWREGGLSLVLFLLTAVACVAVAGAALAPLTQNPSEAAAVGLGYFGFGR